MRRWLLAGTVMLSAATACADCGGETWSTTPDKIRASVLKKATGALSLHKPLPEGRLEGYSDGDLRRKKVVAASLLKPVSIAPACGGRGAGEGFRFPVIETSSAGWRIAYDVESGAHVWVPNSIIEGYFAGFVDFWAPRKHQGMNVSFLDAEAQVRRWPSAKSKRVFGVGGVKKAARVVNGYIELWDGGWEGAPLRRVGWVSIRDEKGRLQVWPWYYDDC